MGILNPRLTAAEFQIRLNAVAGVTLGSVTSYKSSWPRKRRLSQRIIDYLIIRSAQRDAFKAKRRKNYQLSIKN